MTDLRKNARARDCVVRFFVQRFAAKRGVHIPDPDPDYAEHEEAA